jgi:HTH-type transcriptional regulator / antitoxin HipB
LNVQRKFKRGIMKKARKRNEDLKVYTLDEAKDKLIGKRGTDEREEYEMELSVDVLSDTIKRLRLKRDMTQTQLGNLVGVQKAQISRLENNPQNITLGTALKVFTALKTKVRFVVQEEKVKVTRKTARNSTAL